MGLHLWPLTVQDTTKKIEKKNRIFGFRNVAEWTYVEFNIFKIKFVCKLY